jgi:hypothetical protein
MNKKFEMLSYGQGTIEYLVILAIIVVISLLVVSLIVTSGGSAESISSTQSQVYWKTQTIAITDAVADYEGDGIFTLEPKENITIKKLVINDIEQPVPETRITAGNTQIFYLTGIDACQSGISAYRITINYVTDDGLEKSFSGATQLLIECSTESISEENIVTENYVKSYPLGSLENPIQISNCSQLQDIRLRLDANYILTSNIDCSETTTWSNNQGFEPIGSDEERFLGSLDGQGKTITDLFINRPGTNYVGLFGYVNGTIKNTNLVDCNISGESRVGTIIGQTDSTAQAHLLNARGTVKGKTFTGGLIGDNRGYIEKSSADVNTHGQTNSCQRVGGLVGYNSPTGHIDESFAIGNVSCQNLFLAYTGGLVGYNVGAIFNSYTAGLITGSNAVGGITGMDHNYEAGQYSGKIGNSYAAKILTCGHTCSGLIGAYDNLHTYSNSSSFYDRNVIGNGVVMGSYTIYGTPKYTYEMQQEATFIDWDFDDVWNICEGSSYPFLRWEGKSCS